MKRCFQTQNHINLKTRTKCSVSIPWWHRAWWRAVSLHLPLRLHLTFGRAHSPRLRERPCTFAFNRRGEDGIERRRSMPASELLRVSGPPNEDAGRQPLQGRQPIACSISVFSRPGETPEQNLNQMHKLTACCGCTWVNT